MYAYKNVCNKWLNERVIEYKDKNSFITIVLKEYVVESNCVLPNGFDTHLS